MVKVPGEASPVSRGSRREPKITNSGNSLSPLPLQSPFPHLALPFVLLKQQ